MQRVQAKVEQITAAGVSRLTYHQRVEVARSDRFSAVASDLEPLEEGLWHS